jgi:hypothetical protein
MGKDLPCCPKSSKRHHRHKPRQPVRPAYSESDRCRPHRHHHHRSESDCSERTEVEIVERCGPAPAFGFPSPCLPQPNCGPCGGCRNDGCGYCFPNPCGPSYCSPCGDRCCPNINVTLEGVTTTPIGSNSQHSYSIRVSQSQSYFSPLFRGVTLLLEPVGSGSAGSITVLCGGLDSQVTTFSTTTASASAPSLNVYAICGGQRYNITTLVPSPAPAPTPSVLASISQPSVPGDQVATIAVSVSNTGSTDLNNVTLDLPQPVNTSAYTPISNFAIVNLPSGTVMRFSAATIAAGQTATGSFTVQQDLPGSYSWTGEVVVDGQPTGVTVSLTTTYVAPP